MLLVGFKRSKRMRYFHGSENECMFKNEVLSTSGCLTRRNVFPGDGLQNTSQARQGRAGNRARAPSLHSSLAAL